MALTEEQKTAFWRDGFLPVHDVLTADEVSALRQRTDDIILGNVPFPSQYLQIEPVLENGVGEDVPRSSECASSGC